MTNLRTDGQPARTPSERPPSALDKPLVITEQARELQLAPPAPPRPSHARHNTQVRVSSRLDMLLGGWLAQIDSGAADAERRDVDALVHRLLVVGLGLSSVLMVTGLALDAWLRRQIPAAVPGLADTLSRVLAGRPSGFLALGLLVLIATPIVRVIGSIAVFSIERDWRYAAISLIVLLIVTASVILG